MHPASVMHSTSNELASATRDAINYSDSIMYDALNSVKYNAVR